jgi:riboflavin synthase
MFTGIVTAVGTVTEARADHGGRALVIKAPYRGITPGESVAVDGACLTVTRRVRGGFAVHVIRTTLDRTRFAAIRPGRHVNLERALRVGDRLGGHLVQGHVDGLGTITRVAEREDTRLVDIRMPTAIAQICVPLGSITVDGVSLTVNALPGRRVVQVALIPYTLQHTTLGDRRRGDTIHLEGDTIGKYVAALMARAPEEI